MPPILTGFALAFARAVGEYGSVIFIAGNIPYVSEIAPLLIVIRLQEFDYAGATAIATIVLVISFVLLLVINLLQAWSAGGSAMADAASPPALIATRSGDHDRGACRAAFSSASPSSSVVFLLLPLATVFVEALRPASPPISSAPPTPKRWRRSG